ncbi:bifunctional tRNA pseudouridine(32) synthase/23S rRNA pseudouridine(746) synthase RluA [Psychrosphaera sp. 1_MG-2023]|uniref:bifunctional tRNA pseudouridine(32) synthase/23S rRNA pseudouridine(746) synthase RluA n=1 Tax=Psychrosphaera sp. 1_MG-2023 TaxID=3062643 RepID=UPI0026E28C4C|nr:bifunctional tRNA pseudouridine(32) synthase/23S rRNA pseudouridine(746) synthase RluA [Psychrosphaera sp. 1_MG-2023]MDO6719325.1 bifunctional tRNA pseudouridine(32) synthase/23S rRNA pseudouridine(746) synthase RluA [Psychrosphaera sp. 1_MG-2023]
MAILNYSPPMDPYLQILYRDEHIIALNKPSGLLSVPGRKLSHFDSLMSRVQAVWPNSGVVHRLDMMTSGIMIMAMHKDALRNLNRQFQERQTQKEYIANVSGHVENDSGEIDLPLICDWPNRPKQKVCYDTGKASLTKYIVLERGQTSDIEWTRVKLIPITGRSHQLRVHLKELGHPILGDRLYAPPHIIAAANRLNLHAQMLTVHHPLTDDLIKFEEPAPF